MNPVMNSVSARPVTGQGSAERLPEGGGGGELSFSDQLQEKLTTQRDPVSQAIDQSTGHRPAAKKEDKEDQYAHLLSLLHGMLHTGKGPDGMPLSGEQRQYLQRIAGQLEQGESARGRSALIAELASQSAPGLAQVNALVPGKGGKFASARQADGAQASGAAGDLFARHAGAALNQRTVDLTAVGDKLQQTLNGLERPHALAALDLRPGDARQEDTGPVSQQTLAQASEIAASLSSDKPEQEAADHQPERPIEMLATPAAGAVSSRPVAPMPEASGVVTATIDASVGSQAWQREINQHVALFVREGVSHAALQLHPAELGALKINLSVNNDVAQLHFASGHQQVREILESALPQLRSSLAEAGIQLGQSSVGAESFASSQQQQSASSARRQEETEASVTASGLDEVASQPVRMVTRLGGVDTFV